MRPRPALSLSPVRRATALLLCTLLGCPADEAPKAGSGKRSANRTASKEGPAPADLPYVPNVPVAAGTFVMGSDGSCPELLWVPGGGSRDVSSHETVSQRQHFLRMQGRELFKFAVNIMRDLIPRTCEIAGVSVGDLKLIVPHQVNKRVLDAVKSKMDLAPEKMTVTIDRYGNSSAASVPVALCEAVEQGRIDRGDLVLLMAFGGGLTWASALVRW